MYLLIVVRVESTNWVFHGMLQQDKMVEWMGGVASSGDTVWG